MRQGELLGLTWSDIDLSAGILALRRSLQWQPGNGLAFTEPKTAHSRRSIHLARKSVAALRAHQDRQAFERKAAGESWTESDVAFCDANGAPLSRTNETKRF
jgi:integrase